MITIQFHFVVDVYYIDGIIDNDMTIKFLKHCTVQMENWHTLCECCGPQRDGYVDYDFFTGEEVDPDESYNAFDVSQLTYLTDYEIVSYP